MATSISFKNENTDQDQTDVYQDLSSHLYQVLDGVGLSEEVRKGQREEATAFEIIKTTVYKLTKGEDLSWYRFGSQYEGTTTRGLHSDMDILLCDESRPVVENIHDAPPYGQALLMLSEDTKPGYVKLQLVFSRTKLTIDDREVSPGEITDHHGRILLKQFHSKQQNLERHGPADTSPESKSLMEIDFVHAYRCRSIPSFADEWLQRPRPYQWPSQEQLQRMALYGCFFVGVSHPKSENKETEWRISFSLQERDLMCNLNSTQHKCYVLLKMIKKDIVQPRVGASFSSYHCKTCIFHLAESHGVEQWTPNNLVYCILECLRLLLKWVKQENCPNYFITDENMFDRLDRATLTRLSIVLQELLSNEGQFLYEIKYDDLGTLLKSRTLDRCLQLEVKRIYRYSFHTVMMQYLLNATNRVCRYIEQASIHTDRFCRANYILQYLKRTTVITEHMPSDVRMFLDKLIPCIRFVLVQMKFSDELVQIKRAQDDCEIQALIQQIQLSEACDLFSSRLIAAWLYLQCDKLDSCQELLQNGEASLKQYVASMCICHDHPQYINKALKERVVAESLSFEQFRRECTAACMIFLPSEANIVPAALRYEMYRSVYTPPGSRVEDVDYWYDWIVVDSKVYLFLLQYILYVKANKQARIQVAINSLRHLIITDRNLGHRETALNLLGWIYCVYRLT